MNNAILSLIIAAVSTFFIVITEKKKEERVSVGTRSFIAIFFVSFVALTYLLTDVVGSQEIETGEPNF